MLLCVRTRESSGTLKFSTTACRGHTREAVAERATVIPVSARKSGPVAVARSELSGVCISCAFMCGRVCRGPPRIVKRQTKPWSDFAEGDVSPSADNAPQALCHSLAGAVKDCQSWELLSCARDAQSKAMIRWSAATQIKISEPSTRTAAHSRERISGWIRRRAKCLGGRETLPVASLPRRGRGGGCGKLCASNLLIR